MAKTKPNQLRRRAADAAQAALNQHGYVTPIDVLLGMRWLTLSALDRWRQARIPNLEAEVQVDRSKISLAFDALRSWAQECGLEPSEGEYLARSRGRTELAFTTDGDADLERRFRIRWTRPGWQSVRRKQSRTRPPSLPTSW